MARQEPCYEHERWGKYTDLTRSQPTAYKDKLEVQCNQLKYMKGVS